MDGQGVEAMLVPGSKGNELKCGRVAKKNAESRKHFEKAVKLARSRSEKNFFERKSKVSGKDLVSRGI